MSRLSVRDGFSCRLAAAWKHAQTKNVTCLTLRSPSQIVKLAKGRSRRPNPCQSLMSGSDLIAPPQGIFVIPGGIRFLLRSLLRCPGLFGMDVWEPSPDSEISRLSLW